MRTALPFWRTTFDGPAQNCLARDEMRKAHDFSAPGLAHMGGILSALEQVLMQHLVQQGAVLGDEVAAPGWQLERDGAAARVVSRIVRACQKAMSG